MENNSPDSGAIVFDTSSGFSVEEQREILDRINSLGVEKSIVPRDDLLPKEAKKKGFLFPLLVNFAALLILAAGFAVLWLFHSRDEGETRRGTAVLDLTERTLIQEIRRETSLQLNEKDKQINDILANLAEADAEYRSLQLSVETLSEEQRSRAAYLLSLQEEYRETLTRLQDERIQILEDSRLREAGIRLEAEERVRELSAQIELSQASLGAASEELVRLSGEQEQAAGAEALLAGYYAVAHSRINAGELPEAAEALRGMRDFLAIPLFRSGPSMEARKQTHLAVIAALEDIVARFRNEADRLAAVQIEPAVPPDNAREIENAVAPLEAKIAELEQAKQDQERIIGTLNSQDSRQSQLIAEYDSRINTLETQLTDQQAQLSGQRQTLSQRDNDIQELRGQAAAREQRIAELDALTDQQRNRASELGQANGELLRQLNSIPQVVEEAIEDPAIQNLLGPGARQALVQAVQGAIQEALEP